MTYCTICNKDFHPLGYASHRAKHTRELQKQRIDDLYALKLTGWDVKRNDYDNTRFHLINPEGRKLGLYTWNEAIRIGLEQSTK